MPFNEQTLENIRLHTITKLNSEKKTDLGQFMTSASIAKFMAQLFDTDKELKSLLDCGAGIGTLTISAIKHLGNFQDIDLWEIDEVMLQQLKSNMNQLNQVYKIIEQDFILDAVKKIEEKSTKKYSHAIINPPYKKINSKSIHRKVLRTVNIETVNLYSAFLALTILMMEDKGEIVAIIPRSFCNGPYYKSFRKLMLRECSIKHIHLFEKRNEAFKDDKVLQENIIIKLVKNGKNDIVTLTKSTDQTFMDLECQKLSYDEIVMPTDKESFIYIPVDKKKFDSKLFQIPFSDLGVNVSTGPVVDFRIKSHLKQNPDQNTAPLLYPHHFRQGTLEFPVIHKKPNAIKINDATQKWLMPNSGYYVLVKRFSTKEEKKRVVAYVIEPKDIKTEWLGFENHWNVFHVNKKGMQKEIAKGIACFLNTTQLDQYFRTFSGHTQVNATDLKNLKYPSISHLTKLGKYYSQSMNQSQIDGLYKEVIQ